MQNPNPTREGQQKLIGFVVLFFEDVATISLDNILRNAIQSGQNRAGLSVEVNTLFDGTFCAGTILCSPGEQDRIIDALKGTLAELGLLSQSSIGVCDVETLWRVVVGVIPSGANFAVFFQSNFWKSANDKREARTQLQQLMTANPGFADFFTMLKGHKPSAQ